MLQVADLALLVAPVIPPLLPGVGRVLELAAVARQRGLPHAGVRQLRGAGLVLGADHGLAAGVRGVRLELAGRGDVLGDDLAARLAEDLLVVAGAGVVAAVEPGLAGLIRGVRCDAGVRVGLQVPGVT